MTRSEATYPAAVATAELDEFWCSDCLSRALFERLAADGDASEWACTACGAAYFDAIDLVAGVSEPSSGRASA